MMYAIKSKEEIINKGLCGWYTMFEDNGKCLFDSKTTHDYSSEGYIVVDEKTFNTLLKEHETALCNDWVEITEEEYENALNVLPPVKWYNGGFFISEALTSTVQAILGGYFGGFSARGIIILLTPIPFNLGHFRGVLSDFKTRFKCV